MFPRLLLLQSKSLRPLLSGEFVGRSSETQREMRKQWNLSDAANGATQTRNHPQNEKTDQKTGRRRIFKMVEHFEAFWNFSLRLKTANFSSLKWAAISSSRKILRELLQNPCRTSFLIPCIQIKMYTILMKSYLLHPPGNRTLQTLSRVGSGSGGAWGRSRLAGRLSQRKNH